VHNRVQLIAYADRLGGSLAALGRLLDGPLAGLFGGVHVLPFFRPYDGADAGFDPVDHLAVDPRLGDWEDLAALRRSISEGGSRDIVADLIVNHVSDRSRQFQDVVSGGGTSPYAGMFLTYDQVFPKGATEADLVRIVRPRPGLPFTPVTLGGEQRLVWTTFTSRQIDLDVRDPAARRYLSEVLARLAGSGVSMVRLDAVGYAVKTAGTSCFLTPETVDFVLDLAAEAHSRGLQVLTEVHAHHRYAAQLAPYVDRVYDFAFAPLVLHALISGDGGPLRDWLARRPANAVTVLDTHDGIGLVDAGPGREAADAGLLSEAQLDALAEAISVNSRGTSRASRTWAGRGGGVYQVSSTAYDALGGDDRRYLLARLLQLFVPGIPQVYYVGLLAGRNQPYRGGDTREINRRRYTEAEVASALRQPVVASLVDLIRFRNRHPAFDGAFRVLDGPPGELAMVWSSEGARAELHVDFSSGAHRLVSR